MRAKSLAFPRGPRLAVPVLGDAIRLQRSELKRILSAYGSNAGPNGLHDLRVALRRTAALARLLQGFPGPKDGRKVRSLANDLRRRLSPARQTEVSLELVRVLARNDEALFRLVAERLSSGAGGPRTPGIADVQHAGEEVLAAMDRWTAAVDDWEQDRAADRRMGRTIERRIRKEAKAVLSIGLPDRTTLHPLRIACKKLRYELEIVRDLVAGVERAVKASRRMQETLGDAHDWVCLVDDLSRVAPAFRPEQGKRVSALTSTAKAFRSRTAQRALELTADYLPLIESLPRLFPARG
jgi:CHAD domain-containing protein